MIQARTKAEAVGMKRRRFVISLRAGDRLDVGLRELENLGSLPEAWELPWMQKSMKQFVSRCNLYYGQSA